MGNTDKGWIKYWRKSVDDPMYFEEPFTKWQAWTDLLLMADKEGSLKTSLKALQIRWKWNSTKRVRTFMGNLKDSLMVTLKSTRGNGGGITIFISKYWAYQAPANAKKTEKTKPKGQFEGQFEGQTRSTIKEGGAKSPPSGEDLLQERKKEYDAWVESIKDEDFDDE